MCVLPPQIRHSKRDKARETNLNAHYIHTQLDERERERENRERKIHATSNPLPAIQVSERTIIGMKMVYVVMGVAVCAHHEGRAM